MRSRYHKPSATMSTTDRDASWINPSGESGSSHETTIRTRPDLAQTPKDGQPFVAVRNTRSPAVSPQQPPAREAMTLRKLPITILLAGGEKSRRRKTEFFSNLLGRRGQPRPAIRLLPQPSKTMKRNR